MIVSVTSLAWGSSKFGFESNNLLAKDLPPNIDKESAKNCFPESKPDSVNPLRALTFDYFFESLLLLKILVKVR